MTAKLKFVEAVPEADLLRLDLGCGKGANTPDGFVKVDKNDHKDVQVVADLRGKWPWKSGSVDEVRANYVLHQLTMPERIHFLNELHRVLKVGGTAAIFTPHWCASRAYCDPDAQWPPVAEAFYPWTNKAWRDQQNVVNDLFKCNFDHTLGYGMHQHLMTRNHEYQSHAFTFWKEAAQDLIVTLTKI